jgi:hypothetical protein
VNYVFAFMSESLFYFAQSCHSRSERLHSLIAPRPQLLFVDARVSYRGFMFFQVLTHIVSTIVHYYVNTFVARSYDARETKDISRHFSNDLCCIRCCDLNISIVAAGGRPGAFSTPIGKLVILRFLLS